MLHTVTGGLSVCSSWGKCRAGRVSEWSLSAAATHTRTHTYTHRGCSVQRLGCCLLPCACRAIAAQTDNDFRLNRQWAFIINNGPDIIAQAYTRSMNNMLRRWVGWVGRASAGTPRGAAGGILSQGRAAEGCCCLSHSARAVSFVGPLAPYWRSKVHVRAPWGCASARALSRLCACSERQGRLPGACSALIC